MAEAPDVAAALETLRWGLGLTGTGRTHSGEDERRITVAFTLVAQALADEEAAHALTRSEFARHMVQWNAMRAQLADARREATP